MIVVLKREATEKQIEEMIEFLEKTGIQVQHIGNVVQVPDSERGRKEDGRRVPGHHRCITHLIVF